MSAATQEPRLQRTAATRGLPALLSMALLLALVACSAPPSASKPSGAAGAPASTGSAPAPASAASAPAAAQPTSTPAPQTVRITVPGASLSYLPAKVGAELGLFQDEGITLEFLPVGGDLAVAAVLSGQAEFTTLTSSAMAAISKGAPMKTVHYQSVRIVHALMGRPEVPAVGDLNGKRIGVQRLGDLTAFEANWVIDRHSLRDVTVLQIGAEQERMAGIISGTIDATFLARPWDLRAEREGMRRLQNMWEVLDMAQVGLVCTTSTLTEQEDAVRRLMRASNRAAAIVRDPARRDAVADIVVRWMEIPPADAQQIVAELRDTYPPDGLASDAAVSAFIDVLKQADAVPPTATVAEMVDFTLARQVAREMNLLQ